MAIRRRSQTRQSERFARHKGAIYMKTSFKLTIGANGSYVAYGDIPPGGVGYGTVYQALPGSNIGIIENAPTVTTAIVRVGGVISASNTSPVVITTDAALPSSAGYTIAGALGNTAINGTPSLEGSGSIASVTAGSPITIVTPYAHSLSSGMTIAISAVVGIAAANGTWTITVIDAVTFTLNGSSGTGTYVSGGMWSLPSATYVLPGVAGNGTYAGGGTIYTVVVTSRSQAGSTVQLF